MPSTVRVAPKHADEVPDVPGRLPLLGHLLKMNRDLNGLLRDARERHGPLFYLDPGMGNRLLIVDGDEGFALYRNKETSSEFLGRTFGNFLGHSVITTDGDEHKRMRGAMSAAFTQKGLRAAGAGELMATIILPRVDALVASKGFEVVSQTREAALDVIFAILGIDSDEVAAWRHWYEEFSLLAINFPIKLPGFPAWRGSKGKRWLNAKLGELIADARAHPERQSLLASVVRGRDEEGRGLEHDELIDNLRLLALAGHETTASTIAWSLLYMIRDPQVWERAADEASQVEDPPTTPKALERFPYIEGIFREALRLHPPVNIDARETTQSVELHGCTIPPGTAMGVPIALLSRDPERYPDPLAFKPQRWVGAGRRPSPIETCQFGGGPHFCLGYHVAMMEGVQYLVAMLQACARQGRRLSRATTELPRSHYVPFGKPHRTRIDVVPA